MQLSLYSHPPTITPSHCHTFPPSHHSQFPRATWALGVASCRVVWQRQPLLSHGWTECYHKWSRCHSLGGEHQPIETPAYGPVTMMCNSTQSFIVPRPSQLLIARRIQENIVMPHLVPAKGTACHVVPLNPHLEPSWDPRQLPAVKGSGTHC